jgi:hypothetical protein
LIAISAQPFARLETEVRSLAGLVPTVCVFMAGSLPAIAMTRFSLVVKACAFFAFEKGTLGCAAKFEFAAELLLTANVVDFEPPGQPVLRLSSRTSIGHRATTKAVRREVNWASRHTLIVDPPLMFRIT